MMKLASWLDSPYLAMPPWRKFLDFWHLQSEGRRIEVLWGWMLTKTSLCCCQRCLDSGWKVMRAGTCPYSGTCLLQEDSCLSSGLKCLMKGTAYVMGAAACMWHFYKLSSKKLTVAGRWKNLNFGGRDLEMTWFSPQLLLLFIQCRSSVPLVSASLNDSLVGCWLSCHFELFAETQSNT